MNKSDPRLLEAINGLSVTLEAMRERLGALEKRTVEPVAQSIVDNVTKQYSGCHSPLPRLPRQMDFAEMMKVIRQGCKVARLAHLDKHIYIKNNDIFADDTRRGMTGLFMFALEDFEAKDWIIL